MLKLLPWLLGLLALTACEHQPTAAEQAAAEAARRAADGPDLGTITDANVRQVLTAYGRQHPENQVRIHTPQGDVTVRLYDDTPLHRANFLLLTRKKFFDEGVFYRVLKDFVVQGGDDENRTMTLGKYKVPSERAAGHIHRRGALAMARFGDDKNPTQASSSHDFYFVQGRNFTPAELDAVTREYHLTLTPEQRKTYLTVGGAPSLDVGYTVFGEVTSGLDVIERISQVPVDAQKWPLKPVPHRVIVTE